jgi:hypothetical protein
MASDIFQLRDRETGDVFLFTPLAPQRPLEVSGRATIAVRSAPGRAPAQQFMGPGTTEVSFGGALYGAEAWNDHLALDRMRRRGHEHDAIWGPWRKRVRIAEARFQVETRTLIRYRLRLIEVVEASEVETQEWQTWQKPQWQAEQILADLSLFELLTRDLRGFLFDLFETLDALLGLISGLVHDVAELTRFGAELASLPRRVITELQYRVESAVAGIENAWRELDDTFSDPDNADDLAATEPEMVTSRLAGERVHALLRDWLRRMVLASYGLRALAGPRRSVRYVVTQGDTLRQIAREELGDAGRWTEIAEANGLDSLDLEPGQVLVIPVEDAA